jgi:hypothetical protein
MTAFRRRRRHDADAELAALADGSLAADGRNALAERVAASPELAERLAVQERAVALVHDAAAATLAPQRLRARIDARRSSAPPRRRRGPLLAGGAAAAIAGAVAVVVLALGSRTSAEQFRAALRAPSPSSAARGEATLTRTSSGWRIELDATGLPRLAGGRFYEAWLRNAAGVLVPVGTFNDGTKVTLWAGVSPDDFRTLTITREQADGDQASSGRKVLVGTAEPRG